jgi:UDP-N-acetylmuramoyl-tripeptide--D-alanyl-D-alanine ligase
VKLDLEQIAAWTGAEIKTGGGSHDSGGHATGPTLGPATGYSIDTRTLQPGDLFFAIRGDRYDAHDFVPAAFERGALAAVIAHGHAARMLSEAHHHSLLIVEDPLVAMQTLASAVRRHWGKRLISITGSAGKTTTKEAIATVLGAQHRVLKSIGNLNNHFGLPLQLLRLEPEDEIAVIEMGMSHAGEIAELARIALPDWGVVSNVGNAHAENFSDGITGIARAKYELVAGLHGIHRTAFLNVDDRYVSQFGRDFNGRVIYFGTGPTATVRAENIEERGSDGIRFDVIAHEKTAHVSLALLGRHNITNALAAIACGLESGMPLDVCAAAIAQLRPDSRRGEMLSFAGATIINDSYNSNPEALRSMIHTLASVPAKRRILVAGEMLELGRETVALHQACGEAAAQAGIDVIIGVRGNGQAIVDGAAAAGAVATEFLADADAAGDWLKQNLREGDVALLKASRGVKLERALEVLQAKRG